MRDLKKEEKKRNKGKKMPGSLMENWDILMSVVSTVMATLILKGQFRNHGESLAFQSLGIYSAKKNPYHNWNVRNRRLGLLRNQHCCLVEEWPLLYAILNGMRKLFTRLNNAPMLSLLELFQFYFLTVHPRIQYIQGRY